MSYYGLYQSSGLAPDTELTCTEIGYPVAFALKECENRRGICTVMGLPGAFLK